MDITDGLQFFAKRKAAQAGTVNLVASSVASAGMVLSITDAIEGKDFIHSKKIMTSAFKKIATATKQIQVVGLGSLNLDEEETGVFQLIGGAIKDAAVTVLTTLADAVLSGFLFAVKHVVIPVFMMFCEGVAATVSVLIDNPLIALGVGLTVGLGYLGYKAWQNWKNSTGTDTGTDANEPPIPANPANTPAAREISTTPIRPKADPKGILASRVMKWREVLNLAKLEQDHHLPKFILSALMAQESGGDPKARSHSNALGLFQLMPPALQDLREKWKMRVNPLDPQQSAEGAAQYLDWLYNTVYHGDLGRALTAYNAGVGTVRKADLGQDVYKTENAEYAGKVLGQLLLLDPTAIIPHSPSAQQLPSPSRSSAGLILPTSGTYSSMFGLRNLDGKDEQHPGIDIANAEGTPIYASGEGVVVFAGPSMGFGTLVVIDHGHGLTTRYGHSRKLFVSVGDHVSKGQKIAEMGNLGKSTGPHLHFEVREANIAKDPANYLNNFPRQKMAKLEYTTPVDVVASTDNQLVGHRGQPYAYNPS